MNYRYCRDKVILNFDNVKEEKGSLFCWKLGVNVYNTIQGNVYKNEVPNIEGVCPYPGFGFTRISDCFNLDSLKTILSFLNFIYLLISDSVNSTAFSYAEVSPSALI